MKRILIGILILILYLALVIAGAIALHFESMKLVLFCLILGLLGASAVAFVLWYLHKLNSDPALTGAYHGPDATNLNTLLREANDKVRQASRAGVKSLASLPLIYVIGDENSAKTQTVLQSGLDPELLAGNVYQDSTIVPTQLANFWLAGNYVLVEAGGALLRQPALWLKLVKATLPARLGSIFSKNSSLPARSVVVCVSIERIFAPNTAEQIRALAQTLNERLRQLSQTLGTSLPIYVLFTKLDNIAPFASYVGRLSETEVKCPIGSLLSSPDAGLGLYTERAIALIGSRFDQLFYALSEFRLDILSRGGELDELAKAYEFPRDLRKLRGGIVSFLAEVARPSQIGVNPFLRGFFFAGMRAQIVEDVLDIGPVQTQSAAPVNAGATRIFSLAAAKLQQLPTPQARRGATRKIPQWVFLPHLFSNILLVDKSAIEISRASTRTSFLKRSLLVVASAVMLLLLTLITISFFRNRSLERRVAAAASASVSPVIAAGFASQSDLETLDQLRIVLNELSRDRKEGPPFMSRMGLYRGDALYPVACRAYSVKFRSLLLSPIQGSILAKLRAVPSSPAPDSDYGAIYRPLKAYMITTSTPNPDSPQDTIDFLPSILFSEWEGNAAPDSGRANLAQTQFAFYASQLSESSSCLNSAGGSPNDIVVAHARAYLNGFQGFQHVYQSMLAVANRKIPAMNFNSRFAGSVQHIVDSYSVPGSFSKEGFSFMQDAILHPDPYFRGEEWVLGPSSGPAIDRLALSEQLKKAYVSDYILAWQTYIAKAQFVPYRSFADAGNKLSMLDSNASAMLEFFSLVSVNTGVTASEISIAFQAPQTVVSPSSTDTRLIGSSNQAYIQSLQALEGAVKNLTLNTTSANDPSAAAPVTQAAVTAEQATENLRNSFVPDLARGVDKASFALLEAPIESVKNLASRAPATAAGAAAKNFCNQIKPLLDKFPFNPQASTEASTEEVAQVFSPGQGSFAQFYNTSLRALITQQGAQYVAAPGSAIRINPAFITFLDNAQTISSALFPYGGTQPSLNFTLTEVKSPGVADAVLNIDGQQITTAGQTTVFHWISQPGSRTSLSMQQNSAAPTPGAWSVFHLGFAATHLNSHRLKYSLQLNSQTNGVVLFEASGNGVSLLNPEFMKTFQCVSSVAR